MECFDSCVDVGKRWSLSKHRVYCTNCGRLNPHYNLDSENIAKQTGGESSKGVKKEEWIAKKEEWKDRKEEWVPYFRHNECKCKQSCWEWILSFLGFGTKLPACCKRVPLTAWDRGEVARAVLVTKVQEVVQRIGSRCKPQVRRTSQIHLREALKEGEKTAAAVEVSAKELQHLQISKPDHFQSGSSISVELEADSDDLKRTQPQKKRKRSKTKPRRSSTPSSSIADSNVQRRSRLLSAIADLRARSKRPPSSSSSESCSVAETDIAVSSLFNPFKSRSFVRKCSYQRKFQSVYCPQLPCVAPRRSRSRVPLSRSRETPSSGKQKVRIQSSQKDQPLKEHRVCKHLQTLNKCADQSDKSPQSSKKDAKSPCTEKCDHTVIKSSSMPCTSCFSPSPFRSRFCRCDPELSCGSPKLPCRSQSFHSTLLRSPSPVASVLPTASPCCRPCAVSTGRPRCRRFKCSCPLDCITRRSRSCSRPCCCAIRSPYCSPPPLCRSSRERSSGPCVDKKSPCSLDCCHLDNKPPICICPPCCTKPCCLPCPRKFTVFPYCPRIDATSKRYLSIPHCTMRAACPCPTGGPCSCPKAKHFPLPCCPYSPSPTCRVACSTPSAMSYIKSKQNDAICQRLLSKYGFSPPLCQNCPSPCYGAVAEGLCGNLVPTCTSNFYSCSSTGSGGCRSCLP